MQNWTETLNAADGEEGEFKESINRMRGLKQFANKGLSPSESTEVPHNFHNPCCIMRDRVIHLVSFQFTALWSEESESFGSNRDFMALGLTRCVGMWA